MSWSHDHLASVETLLFRSDLVKVGSFVCAVDHPCFSVSAPLDNDVFVLPKVPVWIRRNAGDYHFAEPGAILMHRAGSTLERRRVCGAGDRAYWFGVHPEVFVDALQRHNLSTEQMGGALITDPQLRYRLVLFLQHLKRDALDKLAIEEAVLTLFFEICERRAEQATVPSSARLGTVARQRRLVNRARAFLDAHLSENIGLETVAQDSGTSLYHLCRVFREQTGLTMHAYRTRQRLGCVLERLLDGRATSLTELALDTGFASHSHLSRVFQKQMGVSPSSVRATG
jgi:AraC-like DNA-binding protein